MASIIFVRAITPCVGKESVLKSLFTPFMLNPIASTVSEWFASKRVKILVVVSKWTKFTFCEIIFNKLL